MKSWSCFTPHYQEEVACTMGGLHATTEDKASDLTILKSLHPDEWANLTERIKLVDRNVYSNNQNSTSSSTNSTSSSTSSSNSSSSSTNSTPLDMPTHEEAAESGQSGQDPYDRERPATSQQQRDEIEQSQRDEIEQWASDRSQVLSWPCTHPYPQP